MQVLVLEINGTQSREEMSIQRDFKKFFLSPASHLIRFYRIGGEIASAIEKKELPYSMLLCTRIIYRSISSCPARHAILENISRFRLTTEYYFPGSR
jgi:hypothetical protein